MDEASFCAKHSVDASEPLAGTVGLRRTWILLQDHGPWHEKAFKQSDLPDKVKRHLKELGAEFIDDDEKASNTVVLIRNSERREVEQKKLFVVQAGAERPSIQQFEWETPSDILKLPLRCTLAGEAAGTPVSNLLLVCTNGSRDRCCAKFGMPLYRTLSEQAPELVWRSSHLGGHRFAPVMAWLPYGVYYGRVPLEACSRILADIEAGELTLEYFRGRSTFPKPAQIAESLLRAGEQERAVSAYRFLDAETLADGRVRVGLERSADRARIDVMYQVTPSGTAVMPSCGEDAHEPVHAYARVV